VPLETDETGTGAEAGEGRRQRVDAALRRLDQVAGLLDDRFRIPGTEIRFGLDPLLGVVPGGGDWVAWVAGIYVIWEGARLEVRPSLLVRMAGHTIVDLLGGYVPLVGDLFDVAYRSNRKNVELLFDYFDYEKRGSSRRELPEPLPEAEIPAWKTYLTVALLVVTLTALAALPFVLLWWLIGG